MTKTSSAIKPLTGFKKFASIKLRRIIEGYEDLMSKKFPSTYRMIQMFTIGTKDFSKDVLQYMKISKDLTFNRSVKDISYHEMMVYMKTPKDMLKMTPFLLLTAIPFAQYVTLPIAFVFPKQFLSSHYWSIDQRNRFAVQDHTKKLYHYRPVFRHLQKRLDTFKNDPEMFEKSLKIFAKLGSGTHPSVDEVIEIKNLFIDYPYGLNSLSRQHLIHLCRIHGLSFMPGRKMRLKDHICFIQELDKAWTREITERELSLDELKKACFLRGLNPINLTHSEMISWLNSWSTISKSVTDNNLSLLLHAPILLAYNHPSNWRLIH